MVPNFKRPREIAVLSGAAKRNPSRYACEDREHPDGLPDAPAYFSDEQRVIYGEIAGKALPGLLTCTESVFVELAAMLLFEFRRDPMNFPKGKLTELVSILGKLGFSPDARQRFGIPLLKMSEEANPFEQF